MNQLISCFSNIVGYSTFVLSCTVICGEIHHNKGCENGTLVDGVFFVSQNMAKGVDVYDESIHYPLLLRLRKVRLPPCGD
jgi:hypothetical protein